MTQAEFRRRIELVHIFITGDHHGAYASVSYGGEEFFREHSLRLTLNEQFEVEDIELS